MGSVLAGAGLFGAVKNSGGISNALGVQNNYQAGNPYGRSVLQQEVNNQGDIYGQQQTLAQALQAQMAGQGPNPAQTQFVANQQSNIANAQGAISAERGLNPALAARMGSNIAAQQNQNAALGAALLQQQQQLGATTNLGNLYGQMQQGNLGQQQLYTQGALGTQGLNQKTAAGNADTNAKLIGGLINGAGGAGAAMAAAHGAMVPGKAMVSGDSPKNDTVHAMLSPGEVVLPRSVSHDPEKAKEFVDHLLKSKDKKGGGYGDVVAARRKRKAA